MELVRAAALPGLWEQSAAVAEVARLVLVDVVLEHVIAALPVQIARDYRLMRSVVRVRPPLECIGAIDRVLRLGRQLGARDLQTGEAFRQERRGVGVAGPHHVGIALRLHLVQDVAVRHI